MDSGPCFALGVELLRLPTVWVVDLLAHMVDALKDL